MKSKLAIFVILSGWALFIIFIFYEYTEYGKETLRYLLNPQQPVESLFHILLLTVPIGSTITGYLINERRKLFEKTQKSEQKYRNLVDNALVGVYRSNLKGEILYANDALVRMLEFESPEELMSEGVLKRYKNPRDREVLIENLKKTGGVEGFETAVITKAGKTKDVIISAVLKGDTISGMIMDITWRKQAEVQLLKLDSEVKIENAELEALYIVSSAISQTINIEELFSVELQGLNC